MKMRQRPCLAIIMITVVIAALTVAFVLQRNAHQTVTWQAYVTDGAYVQLQFPDRWTLRSLPTRVAQTVSASMIGPEGEVDISYGSGLGGACSQNGGEKDTESMTFNGEHYDVCHVQNDDQTEDWTNISHRLGKDNSFSINAHSNFPRSNGRQTILRILSTLKVVER